MKKTLTIMCVVAILISGCATHPNKIQPTYVSPENYGDYNCEQLRMEMLRVNSRMNQLMGIQESERRKDTAAFTVGMVLFWPALFFMIGDDQKEEIADLKGQFEALEQAAIDAECYELLDEINQMKEAAANEEAVRKAAKEEQKPIRRGPPSSIR